MKKYGSIVVVAFLLVASTAAGQKIDKSNVPSIIVNTFHQNFPRAYDVEWKKEQDTYKVEFETGLRRYDHTAWFDRHGKIVRHKEEIGKSKLPDGVLKKIDSEFTGYRVSDVKKISEGSSIIYTLELKKFREEWKVSFDADGGVISKIPD